MLDMKNAFRSSVSSPFYTAGNSDFQMLNTNVLLETDHNSGFCLDTQLINEGFAFPYNNPISHVSLEFEGFTSKRERFSRQPASFPNKILPRNDPVWSNSRNMKRIKETSFEEQCHRQPQYSSQLSLPGRKSQKLGDKITALQKLVSPFGKTNTASVLQEACLYIKHLQEQIQTLSNSYNTATATQPLENEEKVMDLRSRGLCLVPVSFSGKVTLDDHHPADCLKKIKIPRKF